MIRRRMFRYVVPIDNEAHEITLTGDPVYVSSDDESRFVEFWAEESSGSGRTDRFFQVFATEEELIDNSRYIGTSQRNRIGEVWHLYELAVA